MLADLPRKKVITAPSSIGLYGHILAYTVPLVKSFLRSAAYYSGAHRAYAVLLSDLCVGVTAAPVEYQTVNARLWGAGPDWVMG